MRNTLSTLVLAVAGLALPSVQAQTPTLTDQPVGLPTLPGSMATTTDASGGKVYTIIGGGNDIWNNADNFNYAYMKVTGDFDYIVKVQDLQGPDNWSKAELMARNDEGAGFAQGGDPHISNMATRAAGQNELGPQWRVDRDGVSDRWALSPSVRPTYPNTWLRMERIGSVFYLYSSTNGTNWTMYSPGAIDTAGSSPAGGDNRTYFTNAWPSAIMLGLAVTAHNDTDANGAKAIFSDFKPHVAVPIAITTQPAATLSVIANQATVMSVAATGDPVHYQWRKNGSDIPGAMQPSYTIKITKASDAGTYSVRLYGAGSQVISANSVLTVLPDTTPPTVVLASTRIGTTVDVQFSEYVDPASATNSNNYTIANVTVTGVALAADGMTANLGISGSLPADFSITISNVKDLAGNAIPANTKVTGYTTGLAPGMISYWPLDVVQGTKTPDIISGYDLVLNNLTASDLVAGHQGKCFQFDNARKTMLTRVHGTNDALPIYKYPTLTVSLWVNGGVQTDHRVFCESSSKNNNPLFDLGTHNGGTDGTLDTYIRNDSGATVGGREHHHHGMAFDNTWHHLVYVQHATNTTPRAEIYIDGVLDGLNPEPTWPLTADTTAIGGVQRAAAAAWYTGLIDDVALWNRDLPPDEIAFLYKKGTPTPPPKVLPLTINTFKSDLPAVAKGDSVMLRWDVSKDATSVIIQPDVGDVTAMTSVGVGNTMVTLSQSKTYRLTVNRGTNTVIQDIQIAAIDNVAAGWTLLDNFDRYPIGALPAPWLVTGPGIVVVDVNGNHMVSTPGAGFITGLPLNNLIIKEGQQRTFFARFYLPQAQTATTLDQLIGVSDKGIRWWSDYIPDGGLGPDAEFQTVNGMLQIGTRNGYGSALELASFDLQPQTSYNLWIDIQNDPIATGDLVSIYIAKDGTATRTTLFQGYRSDRNANDTTLMGPTTADLDTIHIAANSTTSTLCFDDLFLSKSGYNSTVPHAYGFTTPIPEVTAAAPKLIATWSQGNLVVSWPTAQGSGLTLKSTTSLASPINWAKVTQAVSTAGTNSTVTIPASKAAEFYQLR